jgi:hypothetical protein
MPNLQRAEIRKAAKYLYPRVAATVEALMDIHGMNANTAQELEEVQRLESLSLNDDD